MVRESGAVFPPASGDQEPLAVVAAVIVQEERLLMVSKQAAPDVFYLPGGKPDPGEGATETLHRELGEELGVRPVGSRFLADVAAQAVLEGVPMMMTVFEVGISQVPHPAAELADTRWVSSCTDRGR
ncbi:NUDIX domain-containing protein [Streptomyces violaceusniger]|uniref:NUDIX hydrolase n=1 Tax=Streptomyces violaceusniger TaxID=68280 RepID=UPI0009987649|nr:NUDIX domain-containing protein [Streptomyces hygroscopicus]